MLMYICTKLMHVHDAQLVYYLCIPTLAVITYDGFLYFTNVRKYAIS